MMNSIRYSPEARNDLREILEYVSIDLASPIAAKRLVNRIRKQVLSLLRFPRSGESLDNFISVKTDYRRLVCGNYLVFYRIDDEYVSIIRVIHGSRNYARILFGDFAAAQEDEE